MCMMNQQKVLWCVYPIASNVVHMIVLLQSNNQHLFYIDIKREQLVKVKVKVTLEQATKAQKGSRCIALLFL